MTDRPLSGLIHEATRPPVADDVTVVVVAYHRPRDLERLLVGLRGQVPVVVVNVDDDPEVSHVAAGLQVVCAPGNPGYAAAVNIGVRAAASDVVVFMNDDLEVEVEVVLALAEAVRRTGAVHLPSLADQRGSPEATIFALPTVRSLLLEWALLPDRPLPFPRSVQKWRRPSQPEEVEAAAAAIVAAPSAILHAEPLPEQYFLYWEEAEWFWRLRERRVSVFFHPELTVLHRGGRRDLRPEKSKQLAVNAVRCVRRTQGRRSAMLAWPVVVLWNLRLLVTAAIQASTRRRVSGLVAVRAAGLRAALGAVVEVR